MATLYTARRSLVIASAVRVLLTTTGATTVLEVAPHRTALYRVAGYGFVNTAATNLTLALVWTDPDAPGSGTGANPQTVDLVNNVAEPIGPFAVAGQPFVAQGDQNITLTATAGTANQIKLTLFIERVAL
jgi:hypothetical protein